MKIYTSARLDCGARADIRSFNVLNLLLPKWFDRLGAYQLPLRLASESTYGGRSTAYCAAVITSHAGVFYFFFPARTD